MGHAPGLEDVETRFRSPLISMSRRRSHVSIKEEIPSFVRLQAAAEMGQVREERRHLPVFR